MNAIILLAVVTTLWLGLAGWIFFGWLTGRSHQERAIAAAQRNWQYSRHGPNGQDHTLYFCLTAGVSWELKARRKVGRRGINICWSAVSSQLPGGMVILLPRPQTIAGTFPQRLKDLLLKTVVGAEALDMSRALHPIPAGSERLREKYFVLGTHRYPAERLLTKRLESLLLAWPGGHAYRQRPTLVLWKKELQVKLMAPISPNDLFALDRLVLLGTVAAENYLLLEPQPANVAA
jgi:hypothetical protein